MVEHAIRKVMDCMPVVRNVRFNHPPVFLAHQSPQFGEWCIMLTGIFLILVASLV